MGWCFYGLVFLWIDGILSQPVQALLLQFPLTGEMLWESWNSSGSSGCNVWTTKNHLWVTKESFCWARSLLSIQCLISVFALLGFPLAALG